MSKPELYQVFNKIISEFNNLLDKRRLSEKNGIMEYKGKDFDYIFKN